VSSYATLLMPRRATRAIGSAAHPVGRRFVAYSRGLGAGRDPAEGRPGGVRLHQEAPARMSPVEDGAAVGHWVYPRYKALCRKDLARSLGVGLHLAWGGDGRKTCSTDTGCADAV
jgi:hypothetical protein